jgi:putative spermidine/putrescine transport system substrate-binding protein
MSAIGVLRCSLKAVAIIATSWLTPAGWAQDPPKPAQIVFNDSGGDMTKAMREAFYAEFEKRYGIRVVTTSPVDAGKLKAMVESGNVEWTVTEIGPEEAMLAEKQGLLEPLDRKVIDLSGYPEHLQDRKFIMPKGVRFSDTVRTPLPAEMALQAGRISGTPRNFRGPARCATVPSTIWNLR